LNKVDVADRALEPVVHYHASNIGNSLKDRGKDWRPSRGMNDAELPATVIEVDAGRDK
jgi:hypothetical protein